MIKKGDSNVSLFYYLYSKDIYMKKYDAILHITQAVNENDPRSYNKGKYI